jgi:lysozyme
MQVNDRFFDFIKQVEGCVLTAYRDTGGVWTIGYGHTGNVTPGQVISEQDAKELLIKDAQMAIDCVNNKTKVPLTQNQFNALVSFTFNVGTGAYTTSTLLRRLNDGKYDDVPAQLRRWVYDQTGNPVLVNRREHEVALWLEQDNDPAHV